MDRAAFVSDSLSLSKIKAKWHTDVSNSSSEILPNYTNTIKQYKALDLFIYLLPIYKLPFAGL